MARPALSDRDTLPNSLQVSVAHGIPCLESSHGHSRFLVNESIPLSSADQPMWEPDSPLWDDSTEQKPLPQDMGSKRKKSLRNAKNSAEVLRQRSERGRRTAAKSQSSSTSNEARHFTVGNVGTGGKLYLRPTAPHPRHSIPDMSVLHSAEPFHDSHHPREAAHSLTSRYSICSESPAMGEQRRTNLDESLASSSTKSSDGAHPPSKQSRAFSLSTIDDTHRSLPQLKAGALRIVIDRSTSSRPKSAEQWALPGLKFSVPLHPSENIGYDSNGRLVPRSSAERQTLEWIPDHSRPHEDCQAAVASGHSKASGITEDLHSDRLLQRSMTMNRLSRAPTEGTEMPGKNRYKQPLGHQIFDQLTRCTDDPSVVRYSQATGAVVAATPARIVAQISSQSFIDYDLVSDFFLTFRAYLSTEDLLSLLLARLSWAINRLQDDGRIIRIRAFAALRHWILNYFLDDFVSSPKLRVRFCDQINELYSQVRERTEGGVSDLKILQDLKRCWNGRCALHWDATGIVLDSQHEGDIFPGGNAAHRDPTPIQLELGHDHHPDPPLNSCEGVDVAETEHQRPSTAIRHSRKISLSSEGVDKTSSNRQHFQLAPSPFQPGASKRSPSPRCNTSGPFRPSTQPGRQNSPIDPMSSSTVPRRHSTRAQVLSASTSDSTREHPLSPTLLAASPHVGNLIRGSLYPPAAPFVDVIASESSGRKRRLSVTPPSFDESARTGSPGNPGVKTIMGSIRRALSSKHGTSYSMSSREDAAQYAASKRGRTLGLPSNMTRSTDNLRDKRPALATKRHLRIDLLCATASHTYQIAQAKASEDTSTVPRAGPAIANLNQDSESQLTLIPASFSAEAGDTDPLSSHESARYGSRLLKDERGLCVPDTLTSPHRGSHDGDKTFDVDFASAGMVSMPLLPDERTADPHSQSHARDRRSQSVDTALARRLEEQGRWADLDTDNDLIKSAGARPRGSDHSVLASDSRPARSISAQARSFPMSYAMQYRARSDVGNGSSSSSGDEWESTAEASGPEHPLRRKPGGNLRKTENAHDLKSRIRRQSTGSLNTRSNSVESMLVIRGHRTASSRQNKSIPRPLQQTVSMIRTHSSQHIRPSFQAAVSGFTTIPDDGDGGLEATLLKLEGRYERILPRIVSRTKAKSRRGPSALEDRSRRIKARSPPRYYSEKLPSHQQSISCRNGKAPSRRLPSTSSKVRNAGASSASAQSGHSQSSILYSEDSDSSIPLLERGLFDGSMNKPSNAAAEKPRLVASRTPVGHESEVESKQVPASSRPSIEMVQVSEGTERVRQGSAMPDRRPSVAASSFLLDEDDHLTDLSSELSVGLLDGTNVDQQPPYAAADPTLAAISSRRTLTHPLAHPPSPASSSHPTGPYMAKSDPIMFQQKPLTPQPSPVQGDVAQGSEAPPSQLSLQRYQSAAAAPPHIAMSPGHIPFALACESVVLAQQLTLVEKAALSEIDWSDLVDMKWDNTPPNALNWAEYLAVNDHRGIDLAITRFDLAVKWVVSEIVMTQDLCERAQVIIKYIHTAAHTRRMHNYASMLQITIALTSSDCTRLKATWNEVPDLEKAVLKDLEVLTQPMRNFNRLRVEMETANLQDGCIPFLGLYVHDLTYNAQKPSLIATTSGQEPLINFERYRTIATIVKSLLRLIDASTRYSFSRVPDVLERCLWLAALSEEQIATASRSIEG